MTSKKFRSLIFDIEGRVAALSHTFRMLKSPLYIIELENNSESHYILIRKKGHFSWHKEIIPGYSYKFTSLKKDVIYKGKYDIEIFTTTSDSSFTKTKEGNFEFFSKENVEENMELISYRGVVTSVVNKEAGIFKLDGNVILIASFLMEVTAELVGEKSPNQESPCLGFLPFCVGDELTIFEAHVLKGREGLLTLVCCGRSLIRNNRDSFPIYNFWPSNYGVLHCLHTFNFGLSFLYWLCDVETFFLNQIFKDVTPQERIKSYKWGERKGYFCKYVEEQLRDCTKGTRSLLLEFLLRDHSCVLKQDFDGFHLFSIEEVLNYEELEPAEESMKDLNSPWRYSYIGKELHKWVLFGMFCVSRTGILRVELNGFYIDLVILGSKEDLYTKLNHTVAVYNFDYICEEFDLYTGSLSRKYIILRSKDVISISENNSDYVHTIGCKEADKSEIKTHCYELKLKSVSGLNFFFADLKRNEINKFFMANATVEHKDSYGNKETWSNVIRFKGCITMFYPFLSEPAVIKGRLSLTKPLDFSFRKTSYFSWMKNFRDQFGTNECTEAPLEFQVMEIINSFPLSATDKIKDVLKEGDRNTGYFNVEGKIIQKWFMTPKFDSQVVNIPFDLISEGVGVPGSKVIRLLLQDKEGYNIWVYLTTGNQFYICPYILGLIPGSVVSVTWLKKCLSQKGSIYLSATLFSNFSILKFDNSRKKDINAHHHFLHELANMPSGSVGLVFATVSFILSVTVKNICSSCEYDFENGSCSFPGCHANDDCKMAGSAKIIIDDGTSTAALFTKDIEIIKTVFLISNIQSSLLSEIINSGPITYKFKSFREKNNGSENENIFAKLVTHPGVFRPLKITCRTFPNKGTVSSNLELFAIDLANLNAVKDISLLKTI